MPIIQDDQNPYWTGPNSPVPQPAPPVQPPSQQAPIPAPPPEDAYNQTVANSIGTQWNVGYEEDAYQQAPPEPEPEAPSYPSYPNPFGEGFEADFQGGPSSNIILPTTSFPSPQQSIQDLYNAAWMQYDQANPMPLPGEGTPLFGTKWFGTPGEQEEQSQNWIAEINKAQTYWNRNIPFGNGAGQTGQEYYNQLQRERQTAERGWSMYQASATQHQLSVQDRFNMQFQQSLNQAARMGEGQDLVQLTGPDGKPQFVPRAIAQQMVAGLTPEMVDAARMWNKTQPSGNPFAVSPPRIQVPGQQGDLYASELDQQNRLQQLTGAQARFFGQTQEKTALDPFGQMPQQDTGLGGALGGIVSNPFTQRLGQGLGAVGRSGFNLPGIGDVTVGGAFSKTFIRPAEIAAQGYTYQAATARQIMVDAGIPLSMVDMIMVGQSPILGMMATANYTPVKGEDISIAHYLSSARETYDTQSTAQRLALELVLDPWNLFPGAAIKAGVRGRLAGRVLGGALDEQTTRTFLTQTKSVFEQRRILNTYGPIQSELFNAVGRTELSDATAKSLAARIWLDAQAGTALGAAREAAIKATYDDLPAMAERVGASETQLRQVRAWLGNPRNEQVIAAITNPLYTPFLEARITGGITPFETSFTPAPTARTTGGITPAGAVISAPITPATSPYAYAWNEATRSGLFPVTYSETVPTGAWPINTPEEAVAAKAQLDLVTEQTPDAHRIMAAAKQQPLPTDSLAGIGAAGTAMTDNMYAALWTKVLAGSVNEGGQPSALLQAAQMVRKRGGLQTLDEFKAFAQEVQAIRNRGIGGGDYQQTLRDLVARHSKAAGPSPTQTFQESPAVVRRGAKDTTFKNPSVDQQRLLDEQLTKYDRNPKQAAINADQAKAIRSGMVSFDDAKKLLGDAIHAEQVSRGIPVAPRTDDPEIALQVSGHLPPVAADDPLRPVLYDAAADRAKISAERWKSVQPFLPKPDLEPTHYPKGRGAWVRPTKDSPSTYKSIIQYLNQIDLEQLSPMVRNVVEELINVEPYKDLTSSSYRPHIQKVLAKDLPEALAHGEATDVDFGLVSGALADAHVQDQVAKANEIERQVAKQARKQPAKVDQETKELAALKTEHADLMNQRDSAWSQGANDIVKMIDKQAAAVKDRITALDPNWLPTERPTVKTATKLAQDHERNLIQHGLTPEVVPPPSDPANGFASAAHARLGEWAKAIEDTGVATSIPNSIKKAGVDVGLPVLPEDTVATYAERVRSTLLDPVVQTQADATTDILTHAATVTTPAPSPVIRPSPVVQQTATPSGVSPARPWGAGRGMSVEQMAEPLGRDYVARVKAHPAFAEVEALVAKTGRMPFRPLTTAEKARRARIELKIANDLGIPLVPGTEGVVVDWLRMHVDDALRRGEQVPDDVLAQYPELRTGPSPAAAAPTPVSPVPKERGKRRTSLEKAAQEREAADKWVDGLSPSARKKLARNLDTSPGSSSIGTSRTVWLRASGQMEARLRKLGTTRGAAAEALIRRFPDEVDFGPYGDKNKILAELRQQESLRQTTLGGEGVTLPTEGFGQVTGAGGTSADGVQIKDLEELAKELNWTPEVTHAADFALERIARRMSPDDPERWHTARQLMLTDLKSGGDNYIYIPDTAKRLTTLTRTDDMARSFTVLLHEEMHGVIDMLDPFAYARLKKALGLRQSQELTTYHVEQVTEGTERLLQRARHMSAEEIAANPFLSKLVGVYVDIVKLVSEFIDNYARRFGPDAIKPGVYKWLEDFFGEADKAGWGQFLEPGELSRSNIRRDYAGTPEGGTRKLNQPGWDQSLLVETYDPYATAVPEPTAGTAAGPRQVGTTPEARQNAARAWMENNSRHPNLQAWTARIDELIRTKGEGSPFKYPGHTPEDVRFLFYEGVDADALFGLLVQDAKERVYGTPDLFAPRSSPNGHRGAYKPTIDPVTAEIEQADWAVLGPKHDAYMSRVYDFSDEARAMQITDKRRLADLSVNSYILENADLTDLVFGRMIVGEAFHGMARHGMNPDEFVREAFLLVGDTKNSVQRLGQFHGALEAYVTNSKKGAAWLREMRSVVPGHDGMNAAQVLGKMWHDGKFNQTPALGWFDKIIKTPKNKVWQEGDLRELNKVLTSVSKPRGMSNNDWIAVLDLRRIIGKRWETFRLAHDPRLPVTTDEINAVLFPVVTPQGVATNTTPQVYDLTGMADKMASMHAALMAERLGFDPDKVDHAMRMMRVVKGNMVPLWMTMLPGYHLRNIMGNATSHLIAALRSDMHVNPLFWGGSDGEVLGLAGIPEAGVSMPPWVDSGMSTDVGSDIQQGAKVGKGEKYALSLWQKEKKEGSERLIHKTLLRPTQMPDWTPVIGGKAVNPAYWWNRHLTSLSDVGERYAKKNAWSQEFRWQYNNEWRNGLNTITLPGNLKSELAGVLDKRVVAQKIAGLDPDTRKQVFLLHERAVAVGNIYGQNTARNTFRDYRMRSKMDGIMDHVIPIHFWTTRNALFVGRTALDRPGAVAGAVMAYNAWEQSNQNLPPSMRTGLARIPKGITTFLGVPDDDDYYMRVGNIINPAVFAVPKLLNPAAWDLSGTSLQERIVNASKSGFQNMWSSMGYRVGPQVDFLFRAMKAADQQVPEIPNDTLQNIRETIVDSGAWFTQRHTPPGYKSGEWNSYNTEFFPWQNLIAGVSRKPNIGRYEAPISPQQAIEWFNQTTTGSRYTRNEYVKIGYRIAENVEDGNLTQEQGMIAMLALADGKFDYDEEYAVKIKARNHTEDYEKAMGGLENIDPAEAKRRREWNNPNLTDAQIDEALQALRPIIDEVADTQAYGWLLQAGGAAGQTRSGTVKDMEAKSNALDVLGGTERYNAQGEPIAMKTYGADDLQRIFHSKAEYERIKDEQGGMLGEQFLYDEHPELLAFFAANNETQKVHDRVDDYMMNTNKAHAFALTALHYAGQRVERARKSPDTDKTINDYYDELGQVMDASERAKARAGDNMVMYDKAHQTMVRMREDVYAAAEADGFNMIGSDFLPREGRSFYAVQAGDLSVLPPRERARYEEAGFSAERRVMEREQEQRAHYLDLALETLGLWDYDSKGNVNPRFAIPRGGEDTPSSFAMNVPLPVGGMVLDRAAYDAALQEEAALVPSMFIELMHQDTREGVDVQVGTLMQGVTEADVLFHTRDKEAKLHAWQAEKSAAAEAAANETDPVKRRELWTAYYDTYTEGPRVYGNDNGFTSGQNRIYNEGGNRLGDMYANNLTPTQKDQFQALHPEAFTEKVDPTEGYTYQSFDWRKLPGEVIAIELDRLGFDADGTPLGIRDGVEYGRNQRDTAPSGRFDAATVTHIEEMVDTYYDLTPEGWDKQATDEALGAQKDLIATNGQQPIEFNGQQMTYEEAAQLAYDMYTNKGGNHTWNNTRYKIPGGPESELGQYITARMEAGELVGEVYDVRDAWFNNLSPEDQKLLLEQGGLNDEGQPQFSVPDDSYGGTASAGGTGGDGGYTRRPWIDYPSRSSGSRYPRSGSSSGGGGGGGSGTGSFYYRVLYEADPVLSSGQDDGRGVIVRQVGDSISRLFELLRPLYDAMPYGEDQFKNIQNAFLGHIRLRIHQNPTIEGWQSLLDWLLQFFTPAVSPPQAGVSIPAPAAPGTIPGVGGPPALPPPAPGPAPVPVPTPQPSAGVGVPVVY